MNARLLPITTLLVLTVMLAGAVACSEPPPGPEFTEEEVKATLQAHLINSSRPPYADASGAGKLCWEYLGREGLDHMLWDLKFNPTVHRWDIKVTHSLVSEMKQVGYRPVVLGWSFYERTGAILYKNPDVYAGRLGEYCEQFWEYDLYMR